jgi:hypothetical protein
MSVSRFGDLSDQSFQPLTDERRAVAAGIHRRVN